MSHPALTPQPLTRAALIISPKAGYLLMLGLVLLAAAWTVTQPLLGLSLLMLGMTFLSLSFLVRLLFLRHERARVDLFRTIETFVQNDSAPSFTTDKDGQVTYRNPAADERFRDVAGETLAQLFGDLFASPSAVLHRLQSKAQISGSAREDVVLRRGHMRLSVHLIGKNGYLWRLDDISDRGPAGRTGENINLPMMTVSKTGTILFMNEALRRLMGGRQTALDRVFTELPVRNGMVARVSAKEGQVNALICEISSSAGRREIYLLPEPERAPVQPGEWDLIDMLPVPLLKLNGDGKIVMANRRARALLGDENAIGSLLSEQVEGAGRPISEWFLEVMAGRLLGRSEVVKALNTEDEVYLQVSLEQMNEPDGRVIVAVLQDATELKTMEAQYLQAQKMQSLGQLAGGIAHDFNNLLTAISGHADLLILRHEESDPDYADLSQILQNSNRAATLVGKLLSFSRKQTLRPEIVDLTDMLGDITHLLNRLVPETVRLELSQDNELLPIRADRHHLEQVLVNLVVNARDAMSDGGAIQLETRNVILSQPLERDRACVPVGDYVMIKVSDQGCGIPADKLTKIFEPFYTTKGVGKGTGLGLSMAYGIIKQMGGYIFVDSKVGAGTSFTLYLPVSNKTVSSSEQVTKKGQDNKSAPAIIASEPTQLRTDDTTKAINKSQPDPLLLKNAKTAEAENTPPDQNAEQTAPPTENHHDLATEITDEIALPSPETGAANENEATEPGETLPDTENSPVHAAESAAIPSSDEEDDEIALIASISRVASEVAHKDEAGELPRPTHPPSPKEGGIVLLVEDEAPVRAFASRALRMRGFTVLEADSAEQALKTLEDESLTVDIFVTDVIMPGMDGPTWVTQALETRPGVKVVFVSGYAEESVSEHQARVPNSVFLPKPFSLSELTATVQQQLH